MAKIIDSTLTCPFCNCKFEIKEEDVKTVKEYTFDGYYKYYKQIDCPLCKEPVVRKFKREESY